jgi:hypothetical protein
MRSLLDLFSEIKQDKALSLYGIALSLAYILTIFFWYQSGGIYFASTDDPWCWPFYPQCWQYRPAYTHVALYFLLLGILASLSVVYFVCNKIDKACVVLFLTWIITLLLVIQDFRFRSNQFYTLSWVTLVYLFAPLKRVNIATIIVILYFWAGRLKLNWSWISGAGLHEKLWLIPESFTVAACVYVIFLQMIFIWGILARNKWIFWITFIQLIAFHLQSFSQIVYWYPWLMFLLLIFFVLNRFIPVKQGTNNSAGVLSWEKSTWILVVICSALQVNPIVYADTPLRVSTWRFLAVHIFEAKYSCNIHLERIFINGSKEAVAVDIPINKKMKCDPVIYWNHARNRCREWSLDSNFRSLELIVTYKRYPDIDNKLIRMICQDGEDVRITY